MTDASRTPWTQLRVMRVAAQLDQEQLAATVGVSQSTISLWESGRMRPSPMTLERLQSLFPGLQLPASEDAAA